MRLLSRFWTLVVLGVLTSPETRKGRIGTIDEVIDPWAVSIVDTPTPPAGPRRIDVNRWEDLLRAAELLGRPILRLHGGEGGPDGHLFYVADGPQSYVFDFTATGTNVARSGAYAASPSRLPLRSRVEAAPLPPPLTPAPSFVVPRPTAVNAPVQAVRRVAALPPPVPEPLEAESSEPEVDSELPSATVVERRIREMIHELLADFRDLPPSSDRLERGTEHIQRAIDMLHLGRYGVAQIELSKATSLLKEERGDR